MKIEKDRAVTIEYKLTNDDGQVIDTTEGRGPLAFIFGIGQIIVGLEKELESKQAGEDFKVSVSPLDGYGAYQPGLVQKVEREMFGDIQDIQVGMQFQSETQHGMKLFTVSKVEDDGVTVDGNHPLAGQHLHFEGSISDVREATKEELDHGHVHGVGGHEH